MDTTVKSPGLLAASSAPKAIAIPWLSVTLLFCLEMAFTAGYELLPQGAQAFARLGFHAGFFRMELSWAKLLGIVVLLAPMPPRLKEWAYAGFAINLVSALIAHLALGEGPQAWAASAVTSVLWGLSYFIWRRRQTTAGA
ncbi:DoxX family protein [Acidobacteria bacterium AB60]|nr:DoxX family protein [Acidobacteria bacterium AB60]